MEPPTPEPEEPPSFAASPINGECWIYQGDENDHLDSLVCPVVISAKQLMDILAKSDAEMLRVKMCEHIAEGDECWNEPENYNICSSTMAVGKLREEFEELYKASSAIFDRWQHYQASAGNQEEAYYKLAKHAYSNWKALEAAITKIEGGQS